MTLPTTPQQLAGVPPAGMPPAGMPPAGVQPGGGFCAALEQRWSRWRRYWLRKLFPGYVQAMLARRQGECPNCTHDIIDSRDLKYTRNVCGYSFRPEDDPYVWRNHLGFARHGFAEMLIFTVAYLVLTGASVFFALELNGAFWILAVALSLIELEIITFFRDPNRVIPADPDAVVSPADGTVTHIEEVEEPEFGKALRISIFLSIFNVHVNRCPRAAEVVRVRYFPGAYLDARNPESAVRNEQLWLDLIEPVSRHPLRVKQISGAIARRIVCWLKVGDHLAKGDRFGMIKLGSRTDLLIPAGHAREICIKVGDKVAGGATVLLRLHAVEPSSHARR